MIRCWSRRLPSFRLTVMTLLLGVVCLASFDHSPPPPTPRVRLAVLVVFDQMRGDYLMAPWQDLFDEGGFRRLQQEGAWFTDCHYPYAHTVTGAGHASLLTGCSPDRHGIVGNNWYDRASGETVYCVADRHELVAVPAGAGDSARAKKAGGVSPNRLLAPTVGDVLEQATHGKARVVALSFKDRSAVLTGGKQADACYWLDTNTGTFVTSTYYRGRLHPWVAEFNRGRPADRWFGQSWQPYRSDLDYDRLTGPDDSPGRGKGIAQGLAFPHPMTGGLTHPGRTYYEALYNSPFGNELLLDLARRAIDGEQLGQRGVPDLLCVSFSCNDPIGHCWGPDSHEVLDVTLRSDRIVRDLLAHLDARVGRGNYLLALSADHGICPLPEVARAQGKEAGRVSPRLLSSEANDFLNATYGGTATEPWIQKAVEPWIYLDPTVQARHHLNQADVERKLADWLETQPGVLKAYTRTQLVQGLPPEDEIGARVQRSFHPQRSGDVGVVLKPYHIFASSVFATGTTHGSPHPYDTHVPLLVYGPGIPCGQFTEAVTPQAIAAIFAYGLGLPPPDGAVAPVPASLLRQ